VVPAYMADNEKIHSLSQKEDDPLFRSRIPSESEDLGSRKVLANAQDLIWYPAEINTSIRPGWFYHPEEDEQVRSFEELSQIYLQSVGGNASFLLNVPPTKQGLIHEADVHRLAEIGQWLKTSFAENLLQEADFHASTQLDERPVVAMNSENGYWQSPEMEEQPWISAQVKQSISPKYLVLQEEITQSQRIEAFRLLYWQDEQWQEACSGTVVGHKKIAIIPHGISAQKWKLEIRSCRLGATLKTFILY